MRREETPPSIADRGQCLIAACERLVSGVGPKPGSDGVIAKAVARLTTPLGLFVHGVVPMGATFYAWLFGLLVLFMVQRGLVNLQLDDVHTIEGLTTALTIYFTIAIALASPSHDSQRSEP